MKTEKTDLYSYFGVERPKGANGYINSYIHSFSAYYPTRVRPAIIVIAGGGYSGICEREGEPVALAYFAKGFNVFTLEYSVAPVTYPAQLIEGCMAVAYVKDNAESLGIDKNHVAVAGFSAGGHLAAMTATLFSEKEVLGALKNKSDLARPDAVILGYPVITSGLNSHSESIANLTGGNKSLFEKVSIEKQVSKNSAPAFIWGTADDGLVPGENAMLYASACKDKEVFFEFHMFSSGPHGLGLCNKETATPNGRVADSTVQDYIRPDIEIWFDMSLDFLNSLGFCVFD